MSSRHRGDCLSMGAAGFWAVRRGVIADPRCPDRADREAQRARAKAHDRLRCRRARECRRLRPVRGGGTSVGNGASVAAGFVAGALTFYVGDELIERMDRGSASGGAGGGGDGGDGLPILLGAVLDGIPESIVLGLSLVGGVQAERRGPGRGVHLERPRVGDRIDEDAPAWPIPRCGSSGSGSRSPWSAVSPRRSATGSCGRSGRFPSVR